MKLWDDVDVDGDDDDDKDDDDDDDNDVVRMQIERAGWKLQTVGHCVQMTMQGHDNCIVCICIFSCVFFVFFCIFFV